METIKTEDLRAEVATLLRFIWQGIPGDYKSRYRMTIWEQFENEIRSAAYTSSLAKFINRICSRLGVTLGKNDKERGVAEVILQSGRDAQILRMLRSETTLLILMVRVENEERREEWKSKLGEKLEEEGIEIS